MLFFFLNLVVPVIFRNMFIDEVHKLSSDVCLNAHAVGRVEPNYVSLPVLAAVVCSVSCRFLAFSVQVINFLSCPPCLSVVSLG